MNVADAPEGYRFARDTKAYFVNRTNWPSGAQTDFAV